MIVKAGYRFRKFKTPAKISLFGFVTAFLTYRFTENLSTAIIIVGITYILIVVAHPNPGKLVRLTVIVLAAGFIIIQVMRLTGVIDKIKGLFPAHRRSGAPVCACR